VDLLRLLHSYHPVTLSEDFFRVAKEIAVEEPHSPINLKLARRGIRTTLYAGEPPELSIFALNPMGSFDCA